MLEMITGDNKKKEIIMRLVGEGKNKKVREQAFTFIH